MNAAVTPSDVEQFRGLIVRHLGLQFDDAKLGWLAEVLQRRCGHWPCARYLAQLSGGDADGEFAALAPELTVSETYFFRHLDQFDALRERVGADVSAGKRRLQILSAGCASGEEAYSIAMMLWDLVADAPRQLCIQAVDLNPAMIAKARRARYTAWALRETPQSMRQRWFRQDGSEWVLDDRVRAAVTFEVCNLCEDNVALWLSQRYDFVFCRNVLMYFEPLRAQELVGRITRSLVPGGCLFLGHAETLRGLSEAYHLRHVHRSFHYERKKGGFDAAVADVAPPMACAAAPHAGAVHAPAIDGADNWVETIGKAAERVGALSAKADAAAPPGLAPGGDRRWLDRAFGFFEQERFAEALELMQSFSEPSGRNPEALLLRGVLLVHVGRLAPAEEVCHRLLAIDELNAGAHYVLALCREGLGDCRGAVERDQMAARLDPSFAMPRLHLGLLARRAGDRDAQRREFAQAKALLEREDASRLMLFGGGFGRDALLGLCRAELASCGAPA